MHHPILLIYEVCPWPIQRPNKQVEQMIEEYLKILTSKEYKKSKKDGLNFEKRHYTEEIKKEVDEEESPDLIAEPKRRTISLDMYEGRGLKNSLIGENKNKKKQAHTGIIGWWFASSK